MMAHQRKYKEPYILKAQLLAWSEFNINEIDLFISVFKTENNNEIYRCLQKTKSFFFLIELYF